MRAAQRLQVCPGVPVGVEDDDRRDGGQVDAQPARPRREKKQERFAAGRESATKASTDLFGENYCLHWQ